MIDVLITYSGRELYLRRLLRSVASNGGDLSGVKIWIVGNGVMPPNELPIEYASYLFREKASIGKVMEHSKNFISAPTMLKLDDDALIVSSDFFPRIAELVETNPNSIFSPFPVGLINNLGGPKGRNHEVEYAHKSDTYYTKRMVGHVGGFARIMPTDVLKKVAFEDAHNEDSNVSGHANARGIPMFYLENGLIVEHQESTLGQHARYKEYFGGRF